VEYQQIAAGWFLSRVQYGCPVIFVVGCCGTVRVGGCPVFVFGTLLGPEATGPSGGAWPVWVAWFRAGLCVSGFLAAFLRVFPVVPLGVAGVRGVCGTGLLFENYIVDASI
jgi:hypothetical protein